MAWFRTDDTAPEHEKFLKLDDDAAIALWWRAGCYCNRQRTDGYIPVASLRLLSLSKRPQLLAAKLVEAGLWNLAEEGGWRIHNYERYQPTRDAMEARLEAVSEAKREAGRLGGQRSAEVRWGSKSVSKTQADGKQTVSKSVSKTQADGKQTVSPDPDPDPDPDPGSRIGSADPTEARRSGSDARALASIDVPDVVPDLEALARELAAEGSAFGVNVVERLDALKPVTQAQRATLRRIAAERADVEARPHSTAGREGSARDGGHDSDSRGAKGS